MSNRDGMRRLRQARRAAGFKEVAVWVPRAEAETIATVARSLLVAAARMGRPLPGDPELAEISAGLDREALVERFFDACAEAGRLVAPWRLGFDDRQSAELYDAFARAAHADYRRSRDELGRQDPGADAAAIEAEAGEALSARSPGRAQR